jgi:hypothetical protein
MKREPILQVFVGLLGFVYLSLIYPLYTDLWHSKWRNEQCMRAHVVELVYRARAVSTVGRQKASERSIPIAAECKRDKTLRDALSRPPP